VIGTFVFQVAALAAGEARVPVRPDLEVTLHIDGGMTQSPHYFILKVNFSGEVEGGGDLNPGLPPPPKRLSPEVHAKLAEILRREHFFKMRNLPCPVDLGFRSIQAWQGSTRHSVSFCIGGSGGTDVPLREAQAILRVWYGILSIVGRQTVTPIGVDRDLLARKP
jgi:hypothetical protein